MEVSDARKLKALEDENRRLKKLLAESMLNASTLKEMLEKTFSAHLTEARGVTRRGGPVGWLTCIRRPIAMPQAGRMTAHCGSS